MSEELKALASERHCGNGGCKRPLYRGIYCFRCWAGVKWFSITQRLRNANGHCKAYVGLPLGFTRSEFISWVLNNPPPKDLELPSIDRIIPELGYAPGNIRWLEMSKNRAGLQRDLPDGMRCCTRCMQILSADHFGINQSERFKRQHYCKPCKLDYDRQWRHKQKP